MLGYFPAQLILILYPFIPFQKYSFWKLVLFPNLTSETPALEFTEECKERVVSLLLELIIHHMAVPRWYQHAWPIPTHGLVFSREGICLYSCWQEFTIRCTVGNIMSMKKQSLSCLEWLLKSVFWWVQEFKLRNITSSIFSNFVLY